MSRVVITGIGAISPLGSTFQEGWEALKAGRSGLWLIKKFDASDIPWKVAGELKDFGADAYLSQKEMNRLDPFVQYAVAASVMAAEDSGLMMNTLQTTGGQAEHPEKLRNGAGRTPRKALQRGRQNKEHRQTINQGVDLKSKINSSLVTPVKGRGPNGTLRPHSSLTSGGVIIGSSRGGISTLEKALVKSLQSEPAQPQAGPPGRTTRSLRLSPFLMPSTTISMASSSVAQRLGIKGHCLGISNACASGANAIGEAYRLLKAGYKGVLFAGGSEAPVCRFCVEGYGVSGALSKTAEVSASRPFDRTRDGFVLSEGACVLVLEDYDSALRRGANIYGEIVGYGNTSDAFHITRPDPEGETKAMLTTLDEAGINPDEVDYINTHGTGTQLGDIAEAQAIKMVFGKRGAEIPASATKSATGHMLAASGALEIAFTLITMREGCIPPTINLNEKDPACGLNIITEKMDADIRIAISNSFGFGGVNAALALKRLGL